MLRNVFLKTIRDRRRSLVWWSVGLVALTASTVAFWPTIEDSAAELNRLLEDLPRGLRGFAGGDLDLTSPQGYLGGRVFAFLAPILFLIFTIGFGSRTIAGEEREGTLELLLARPIARWRIVAEKFGALTAATILLGVVLWGSLTLGALPVDLDVGGPAIAGAVTMLVLLALAFGALALFVGSWTGRRALALGTAAVVAVATYLIDVYAPISEAVEPFRGLSPFYYYDAAEPLRNGLDPAHAVFLILMTMIFTAFALVGFERRDVGV